MKDLQTSIACYTERLGFPFDFTGPADGPYHAGVSRDGVSIITDADGYVLAFLHLRESTG